MRQDGSSARNAVSSVRRLVSAPPNAADVVIHTRLSELAVMAAGRRAPRPPGPECGRPDRSAGRRDAAAASPMPVRSRGIAQSAPQCRGDGRRVARRGDPMPHDSSSSSAAPPAARHHAGQPRPHGLGDSDAERLSFEVRLAVDVGEPHQRRHVVAFAEQRMRCRSWGGGAASRRSRPGGVALLGAGLARRQSRCATGGRWRAARRPSRMSWPFQRSNRAAISTTASAGAAPSFMRERLAQVGIKRRRLLDRAMDHPAGHRRETRVVPP